MAASREIYASGVTIEHFMMGCLLSSFQGESPQVQSMMVNDINSDKVGPGMQLEELVSKYSTFIATMNSIDGPSRGINGVGLDGNKKKGGDAHYAIRTTDVRAQENSLFRWKMRKKGYGFLSYHCRIPVRYCL